MITKPKHFIRIKLFFVGIFCAFAALVKPDEIYQMYEDADNAHLLRQHKARMDRFRSQGRQSQGEWR